MTTPKLHHFVPQFHLRRFANANEKICVWDRDRDRTFWTGANSIAAETHFYRLHQYEALGHDGATMEKQLSALEAEASAITDQWLGWLRDACPRTRVQIPDENRTIVAQYMALQYLRTSDTRQMLGAFAESVNGATATTEELRRLHTELLWDEAIVASLTDRFYQTVWLFARNESERRFITSDNPIAFRTNDNREWRRAALQGDTYAVYPLAPDMVMYCYPRVAPWGNKLDQFADCLSPVSMTEEMVRSENSGQVFMATRFVFSNADDFTWEREFAPTIGTDTYKTEE